MPAGLQRRAGTRHHQQRRAPVQGERISPFHFRRDEPVASGPGVADPIWSRLAISRVRSVTSCRASASSKPCKASAFPRCNSEVIQSVFDLEGKPLEGQTHGLRDKTVAHIFTFRDGKVARFDISDNL